MIRIWARWPTGLTPKVADIVPGSPIALEEIPPTDGLLAGTCHLALALAGSLRAAVVAHFVGNMEDEGLTISRD